MEKELAIYDYSALVNFELNEDGNSILQGKGLSTALGGIAFGGVGALVGSAGKRKSQNTCTMLILRLSMKDINQPLINLNYIFGEVSKDSLTYKTAIENAKKLAATFSYIQSQNNDISESTLQKNEISAPDELLKCKKLLDDGIITQDEFQSMKTKLLNM